MGRNIPRRRQGGTRKRRQACRVCGRPTPKLDASGACEDTDACAARQPPLFGLSDVSAIYRAAADAPPPPIVLRQPPDPPEAA